ncbi:MAG: ribosome maturation factor RimP [Endomicrobium sp.]|jgi:ribosome maturation factor RimP|nr:ribosome maturation factor RimP [Endomicrobium sp.]
MCKEQEIEDLLEPVAQKIRVEIVDIQCVKENCELVVRIFIDKNSGITIDDCENTSHIFRAILDECDIFKCYYVLEISSPGPNRVLKKEESFKRFIGSIVRIQTFNPINNQKKFLGELLDFNRNKIKIKDITKKDIVEIKFLDIKRANIETDI